MGHCHVIWFTTTFKKRKNIKQWGREEVWIIHTFLLCIIQSVGKRGVQSINNQCVTAGVVHKPIGECSIWCFIPYKRDLALYQVGPYAISPVLVRFVGVRAETDFDLAIKSGTLNILHKIIQCKKLRETSPIVDEACLGCGQASASICSLEVYSSCWSLVNYR